MEGYTADFTTLFFVRPVVEGALNQNDNEAVFYAGSYDFFSSTTALEDLTNKLTALYGEGKTQNNDSDSKSIVWNGKDDTQIYLTSFDTISNYTRLVYVWNGAETMIEDALAVAGA